MSILLSVGLTIVLNLGLFAFSGTLSVVLFTLQAVGLLATRHR